MKTVLRNLTAACLFAAAGAAFAAAVPQGAAVSSVSPGAGHLPPGIAWQPGDVDAAFALAPDDSARIERIATSVLAQAGKTRDAFYGANLRALIKVVTQLNRWRDGGAHDASDRSVVKQFDGVCARLPAGDPQAATCATLIQPVKA